MRTIKDRLEYVYKCNCGGFGAYYWKNNKLKQICFSCGTQRELKPEDGRAYKDYHQQQIKAVVERISGERDADRIPNTASFMDTLLCLIGIIDVLKMQAKLVGEHKAKYEGEQLEIPLDFGYVKKLHTTGYKPPRLYNTKI